MRPEVLAPGCVLVVGVRGRERERDLRPHRIWALFGRFLVVTDIPFIKRVISYDLYFRRSI